MAKTPKPARGQEIDTPAEPETVSGAEVYDAREDETLGEPVGTAVTGFDSEGPHPLDLDRDGGPGGSMVQLTTYLTTRASDAFGAMGVFVDLREADAKPHGDLLTLPTPEQLAMRRA